MATSSSQGDAMGEGALGVGIGFVEGFEDGGDAVGGEVAGGCGALGWFLFRRRLFGGHGDLLN